MGRGVSCRQDGSVFAAGLTNFDNFARLYGVGGDVDLTAVYIKVTVTDKLAALCTAGGETHSVENVIEPALQHAEHEFASDTFLSHGLLIKIPKLSFENPVVPPRLLLFTQLQAVAYDLCLFVFSVLTWSEVSLLDRTFF